MIVYKEETRGPFLFRSLSKYYYRHFYRTIRVTTLPELTKLCARATRKTLKETQAFTIEIPFVSQTEETPDPGHPKEEVFAGFLNKFGPKTTRVNISGSSRLAQIVTSGLVASESLPSLKTLELSSTFADLDDPWHPAYYAPLLYYSHLSTFFLDVLRSPESIKPSSKPFPVNFLSTLSPKAVTLRGPLGAIPFSRNLITRFPRLVDLSLFDTCRPSTEIPRLLESITQPEELDTLSIGCNEIDETQAITVMESLSRCSEVRRLKLVDGISFGSQRFYQALEKLDLRVFTFSQNAIISNTHLRSLFSVPEEAHKVLVIDEVRWIDEKGKVLLNEGAQQEEIRKVMQMGNELEVYVTGSTIVEYLERTEKDSFGEMSAGQLASMFIERLSLRDVRRFVESGDKV